MHSWSRERLELQPRRSEDAEAFSDDGENLDMGEEDFLLGAAPPAQSSWRRCLPPARLVGSLTLGQLVSLLIVGTGITSQFLASSYGVNMPTVQSWWNYALLLSYTVYSGAKNRQALIEAFRLRWWRYALLALIDVEANFLVVLAYQYTTITSIMIIDSFAIPWVMVLSYFFLKTRYRWWHVVAVALCLVGLVLLIISDIVGGQDDEAADPLYGDLMCLLGAFLYGVANVWQERLVKQRGQLECLAMLGFFGTLIGGIQVAIFERQELVTVDWSWQVGLLLAGFAICLFCMYSLVPLILRRSSATLLNLSLITSDFYGLLAGMFIFGHTINLLYFGALAFVVGGLLLFEKSPPVTAKEHTAPYEHDDDVFDEPDGSGDIDAQLIDDRDRDI